MIYEILFLIGLNIVGIFSLGTLSGIFASWGEDREMDKSFILLCGVVVLITIGLAIKAHIGE